MMRNLPKDVLLIGAMLVLLVLLGCGERALTALFDQTGHYEWKVPEGK